MTTQVKRLAKRLSQAGVPPDFGPDRSRLLVQVLRALARGRPVTSEQVEGVIARLDIPRKDSLAFLGEVTERDDQRNIIGLLGLSLNDAWAHRFIVKGAAMRTWCAWDTLFLPRLLQQSAAIESVSPVTREKVRLTVSPERVEECSPAAAAVSIVVPDPGRHDLGSMEAIWSNFCHQVYFFASRGEAEEWAAGRNDMAVLSVEEAHELGRRAFSGMLAYNAPNLEEN